MNVQNEIKALKQRIDEPDEQQAEQEQEFKQRIDEPDEQQAEQEQEFPQKYDYYWFIDSTGEVVDGKWDGFSFGIDRLEFGNVFKTAEQAEFALEKLKVEAELREFSRPFKSWKDNYTIGLDHYYEELTIESMGLIKLPGVIYFESEEKVRQAIDTVGEKRIKKYLFGVED